MKRPLFFLLMGLCLLPAVHAQTAGTEAGLPFLTCKSYKDTGGSNQEWVFAQDERGVLYVGDNLGVLEYDGASWRLILTATNNVVRGLDIAEDGRIFVGSAADFGYLEADDEGLLQYVSLLDLVPPEHRAFNDVWTVHATPDGVYFQARERLFRLTQAFDGTWQIQVWEPEGVFFFAFWLDGTYYVHQGDVGLMKMVGDDLELLPGGEQFAGERLQVMLPYGDGTFLVGSFNRGLFRFDGRSFTPFPTEADAFLQTNTLYKGAVLPDGTFGLGTLQGGLVVLDRNGAVVRVLDQATGLLSDTIYAVFEDHSGLVWLAPENGLCYYEAQSPLSRFDAAAGLEGFTSDIIRHEGILYVSTSDGLYYRDAATASFRPVPGFSTGSSQTWMFGRIDDELLLAASSGVYRIEGHTAYPITRNVPGISSPNTFHRSRQDPARVFMGLSDGIATLRRDGTGRWIEEGIIPGIHEEIRFVVEPEPGVLWLGTQTGGALRLTFPEASLDNPVIERFGPENGLPGSGGVSVYEAAGHLVFAMKEGISRFDESSGRFVPDTLFSGLVGHGGSAEEYSVVEDRTGNVWINFGEESAVLRRQADGSYAVDKTALLRFADEPALAIYPEPDGVVWFGGNESLIRYDSRIAKDYSRDFPALVRQVTLGEDSVLYGGAGYAEGQPALSLVQGERTLRIAYAATTYDNPNETLYQTRLEGFDADWSPWTKETRRDFTNLPPREYHFRVRARNIYGHVSREASFAFTMLPPWYRTWWAYLLYAVGAASIVFGLVRVRTRQLEGRSRALEQTVTERTAELRQRNADLHQQKENVELLSRIGKEITASLDIDTIFYKLYESVNRLMDATVFGVGLYHEDRHLIEYRLAIEQGKRYAPYTRDTTDKNQFPVWCVEHREAIFINDVAREYSRYISQHDDKRRLLEDGTYSTAPQSLIYLPLTAQDRVLGVITVQSFQQQAYTEYHLNVLQNLAAYTSIALDNADAYRKLNQALEHLQATQQQLVTQEKLASLGALTAGIAHEIKNPLNFVNNFAQLCGELADELDDELDACRDKRVVEVEAELREILADLKINAAKINEHGRRADGIVQSMLEHSRGTPGEHQATNLNALVEEYAGLSFHGMRAQLPDFNATIEQHLDASIGLVEVRPQEIGRVLLNLLNNAFYAVHERARRSEEGYQPTVVLRTRRLDHAVEIRVQDNGSGIPDAIRAKIFEPFFTTKPTGDGTGLGLSLSNEIVTKSHGGTLQVETADGEGTTFIVTLPA